MMLRVTLHVQYKKLSVPQYNTCAILKLLSITAYTEADHQHIWRYDRKRFYLLTITNMTAKQIPHIQMYKLSAYLTHLHDFNIDKFDI
jgi:hypothetical protein